ncbi:MAG TPA: universal stress protein [Woeseiaceae bacterium]|nr:universal stress protein [Woeseiaceae bacterium]
MKEVSAILLAIDGDYDDQALLAEIASIASDSSARITILSIMESAAGDPDKNNAVSRLQKWESTARSTQLENLSAALSGKGMRVDVQHATGKPYLEIIRETLGGEYDLVIKPATHDRGIRRLLLGGTDIQLLSLCPIPVWIFQPTGSKALKKIAVAVDLQPDDPERSALAKDVLGWGKLIARSVGAELHVIHAWSIYREETLRARSALSNVVDQLSDNKERLHRRWLDAALQQAGLGNDEVHEHLVKGDAREVIPEIVDELDADLLVMGTVGRTGIPGFFIGNTADSVLRNVNGSVLAVKPERFTTPVASAGQP